MAHQSKPYPTFLGWLPVIVDERGKVLHTGPCLYLTKEGAHGYAKTRIKARILINEAYNDLRNRQGRGPRGNGMEIVFGIAVMGALSPSLGFGAWLLKALSDRVDRDLGSRHPAAHPPEPPTAE